MRILMASHGYPPTINGVSLVAQRIARAMVERGHAVAALSASDRRQPYLAEDEGVQLVRLRSFRNPFWEEGPVPAILGSQMAAIADEFRPDVLHSHDVGNTGWQLARVGRARGVPVVATCHHVPRFVCHYTTGTEGPHDIVESIGWAYSLWLYGHFDEVVFATRTHEQWFRKNGLTNPTTIISNGVDVTRYSPTIGRDEDVDSRYSLPPGPRILFVSRLARDKEIHVLIDAMRCVSSQCGAHLLIVGRGGDRARLEGLVNEWGLCHCVHFLGFVPEDDLPALYRAADLFAIASCCEVQSLPTLQAAATGLPVVAVDAMALPELAQDGVNGFLVPPRDPEAMGRAILDALGDAGRRSRFREASLAVAAPHALRHTFDGYEALYARLIRGGMEGVPTDVLTFSEC